MAHDCQLTHWRLARLPVRLGPSSFPFPFPSLSLSFLFFASEVDVEISSYDDFVVAANILVNDDSEDPLGSNLVLRTANRYFPQSVSLVVACMHSIMNFVGI